MADSEQAKEWLGRLRDRGLQQSITGISVVQDAHARLRCPHCDRAGRLVCLGCNHAVSAEARTATGVQYSLSRPDGYERAAFSVEDVPNDPDARVRGGERVTCFAGDSRITMMVHRGQPSVRVTLVKTGRQRYNPMVE